MHDELYAKKERIRGNQAGVGGGFFHHRPATRTHLRWVSGIHGYGIPTGTFNLVVYHFNEFSPTRLINALVQSTFWPIAR